MKSKLENIEIGVGIGELKFGMTPDQVINLLGEPDEKFKEEYSKEDPNFFSEEWHYDEIELSLSFDMLGKLELSTISVSNESYHLNGKEIIGLKRDEVEKLIDEMKLKGDREEFKEIDKNSDLLSFEEDAISFWFEDNILIEIQWEIL